MSTKRSPEGSSKVTITDEALLDKFATLDTTGSDAAGSEEETTTPPKDPSQPEFTVENDMNEFDEMAFAINCIIGDAQAVVTRLAELWSRYASGEMELVATATAAQCTMKLLKQFDSHLTQACRDPIKAEWKRRRVLGHSQCVPSRPQSISSAGQRQPSL